MEIEGNQEEELSLDLCQDSKNRQQGGDGVGSVVVAIRGTLEIEGLIGGSPSREGGGSGFTILEEMTN